MKVTLENIIMPLVTYWITFPRSHQIQPYRFVIHNVDHPLGKSWGAIAEESYSILCCKSVFHIFSLLNNGRWLTSSSGWPRSTCIDMPKSSRNLTSGAKNWWHWRRSHWRCSSFPLNRTPLLPNTSVLISEVSFDVCCIGKSIQHTKSTYHITALDCWISSTGRKTTPIQAPCSP